MDLQKAEEGFVRFDSLGEVPVRLGSSLSSREGCAFSRRMKVTIFSSFFSNPRWPIVMGQHA
jgi:hypothetical protein